MSRINMGGKPLSYPQPVLIIATYDENGNPDAMNAAWGGISDSNEITMCLSEEHKTVKNFLQSGAFTVSMADASHAGECDYLGLASGNDVENKLEKIGFTTTKSSCVNAPVINELAVCLECKLRSYDPESCRTVGEIINVSVDESAMTDGKVDPEKVRPLCFDPFNMAYNVIGEKVADAFKSGKAFL